MSTIKRTNPLKLGLLALAGLAIASSWLVFPYFVQGRQLLRNVGDDSRMIKAGSVSRYLTRELVRNRDLEITATLASNEYFQYVDRAAVVGNLRPDRNVVFFVSETVHRGDLPFEPPRATLHVGDREFQPSLSDGPSDVDHHRLSVYSFPKRDADGNLIDFDEPGRISLSVANNYLGSQQDMTFVGNWDTPYALPEELRSRADVTPVAVLALGAGLLSSVMTPCLLQLVVIFAGIIAGFATVPGKTAADVAQMTALIRRKVTQIAVAFVIGFTLLYALAGALIGAVGHQAQLVFAEYSRSAAIVSGVIVILLGLWVGLRGTRDVACRMLDRGAMNSLSFRDIAGTVIASMGYTLGCTACFGGAIVATLVVYVGAIGSAAIGAGIMLTFAIGVAIPFLLAAFFISRVNGILQVLADTRAP